MSEEIDVLTFVQEAKRLRATSVESECDFYDWLMKGESNELLWRGAAKARTGYRTFEELIFKHDLCHVAVYRRYCACITRFGSADVRKYGFKVTSELLRVSPDAKNISGEGLAIDVIKDKLNDTVESSQTTPSKWQANSIISKHFETEKSTKPKAIDKSDKRVSELSAQNKQLQRKLRDASTACPSCDVKAKEIEHLRTRVAKLEGMMRIAGLKVPDWPRARKSRVSSESLSQPEEVQ